MNFDMINEKLINNRYGIIGEFSEFKRYSVVIPIVNINDVPHILFEVRAKTLRSQPGEIALPGGRIEEGESEVEAALRETCEELGIESVENGIELIGRTDIVVTQHNKIIYPFVARIDEGIKINPSIDEVESVFYVPISFFIEEEPVEMKVEIITKPKDEFPYYDESKKEEFSFSDGKAKVYFYKYKDYIIWGLTGKIIKNFIDEIKK